MIIFSAIQLLIFFLFLNENKRTNPSLRTFSTRIKFQKYHGSAFYWSKRQEMFSKFVQSAKVIHFPFKNRCTCNFLPHKIWLYFTFSFFILLVTPTFPVFLQTRSSLTRTDFKHMKIARIFRSQKTVNQHRSDNSSICLRINNRQGYLILQQLD